MTAATRYDGLLTDEILSRALNELGAIHHEMTASGEEYGHAWLVECERRIGNAVEDIAYVRDCFRKAQT